MARTATVWTAGASTEPAVDDEDRNQPLALLQAQHSMMESNMNIYVGNLSPGTTERKLRTTFEMYGKVGKVTIDGQTPADEAFGFCFVEMPFDGQALRAIRELHGTMLSGKSLVIRESGISA